MDTPNTTRSERHKGLWFLAGLAILGAGAGVFVLLQALKPPPQQRQEPVAVPRVDTIPLEYRQSPLIVEGQGFVTPTAEIAVSAQVNGEVVFVHPNLITGGAFEAGQDMLRIDPRDFQANLAEAQAAKAALEADLAFLEKQIARMRSLRENSFVPEETLDDLISRRDQTLANIARQEAVIQNRELELERTTVKAPFSGRVLSESVDMGDIVSPGGELARFAASDAVEVVVSLNPDDTAFIPGLWDDAGSGHRRAWVAVDHAGRSYRWPGYVHRVEADIDSTTRTVDVVVRVPDPFQPGRAMEAGNSTVPADPPPLLVGMYATAGIEGMALPEHFVVPITALREGNYLWTVTHEGRLRIEEVEFVRQEGNMAVLLAPRLGPGTRIVVSDLALVSDGMQVRAQEDSTMQAGSQEGSATRSGPAEASR